MGLCWAEEVPACFSLGPPHLQGLPPFLGCHVLSGFRDEARSPAPIEAPGSLRLPCRQKPVGILAERRCSFSPSASVPPACERSPACLHGPITCSLGWDGAAGQSPSPGR